MCTCATRPAATRGTSAQDLELTPGRGTADFAAFREALQRAGYRGHGVAPTSSTGCLDIPHIRGEFDYGLAALAEAGWRTDG